jgi:hypothetical protein
MRRVVLPEILDTLPPDDPSAVHSRRDLRKVNTFMGHVGLVARELGRGGEAPRRIVELGAGDGTLLLRAARRRGRRQARVHAVLVDRHPSLSQRTSDAFNALGWDVEAQPADVFDWLSRPRAQTADLMLANLFLHHFQERELSTLFVLSSRQTRRFVACEPRRSRTSLAAASLLMLIGCNKVTRHDAGVSVRAGFQGNELSALWPDEPGWRLQESRAGPFTHVFRAARHDRR